MFTRPVPGPPTLSRRLVLGWYTAAMVKGHGLDRDVPPRVFGSRAIALGYALGLRLARPRKSID